MTEIGATSPEEKLLAPKLMGLAIGWLALGHYLSLFFWHALPGALLDSLTLPAYGMICQVLTAAVGLGVSWAVLARPREALAVGAPGGWDGAMTVIAAPLVFVAASSLALKIAEPYLLEELATQGAGASRRNAGAFGKAVTEAPLFVTFSGACVLAAAYRGAHVSRCALRCGASGPREAGPRASGILAMVVAAVRAVSEPCMPT